MERSSDPFSPLENDPIGPRPEREWVKVKNPKGRGPWPPPPTRETGRERSVLPILPPPTEQGCSGLPDAVGTFSPAGAHRDL
jgi:hypothetical protein